MKQYVVTILGATCAVGQRLISELEQAKISVKQFKLLASKHSVGRKLHFRQQEIVVEAAFNGVDLVLSSAGGAVAKHLLPKAVKCRAVCVDNTSVFSSC